LVEAKIARFRESLPEPLRESYDSLRRDSVTTNTAILADRDAAGARSEALRRRWQEFRNALSESQRQTLRTMSDFTVRD
jgi:hypothetical protein